MTPPPKTKIVCACLRITEARLLKAFKAWPLRSLKDIARHTEAGQGCTACHPLLREYLERQRSAQAPPFSSSLAPAARKDSSAALSL